MKDRPFINFQKVYENVYLNPNKKSKMYKDEAIWISNKKIRDNFKEIMVDMYRRSNESIYNIAFEIYYLLSQITINGRRKDLFAKAGQYSNIIFSHYINRVIGINTNYILRALGGVNIKNVMLFIKRKYPDVIYDDNFLENKHNYKYPYKYMDLICITAVIKLDEMFELLEYGEKKKMSRYEFYDYLVNYVGCYNKKYGRAIEDCKAGELPSPYIWIDKQIGGDGKYMGSMMPHVLDLEKNDDEEKQKLKYEE